MKKLFGKKVQAVEVGNLVKINGYSAGVGTNLFVSLVPELAPVVILNKKKESAPIRAMICTAAIPEGSPLSNKLLDEAEKISSYDATDLISTKIILVSKEFMKLPNKQQLALITIENEKNMSFPCNHSIGVDASVYTKTSIEQQLSAEVTVIEEFGKRVFKMATRKASGVIRKSEMKATKGLHSAYKKTMKAIKNGESSALAAADENFNEVEDEAPVIPAKGNDGKRNAKKNAAVGTLTADPSAI